MAARSLVPSFVRDTLYDAVAGSRFDLFGRSDECRLSDERAEAQQGKPPVGACHHGRSHFDHDGFGVLEECRFHLDS